MTGMPTRLTISENPPRMAQFSYYEYKYMVPHESLTVVRSVLEEFCGGSDPFPEGTVDSIYYDTPNERFFGECSNGDAQKTKFRIRGYGGGTYLQIHQKMKDLFGVGKYKAKIVTAGSPLGMAPNWEDLFPQDPNDIQFQVIAYNARRMGPLLPSIRVKYHRFRYRAYDYRITLDTNIEVFAMANGLPRRISNATLPWHVLEIKTMQTRPKLPFIGLIALPQVSFSKFMLGLQLLNEE